MANPMSNLITFLATVDLDGDGVPTYADADELKRVNGVAWLLIRIASAVIPNHTLVGRAADRAMEAADALRGAAQEVPNTHKVRP